MIEFIASYTFTQLGTTGKYSAIAILRSFQVTVTHAIGFSVFTSRIFATDLSQFHYHVKSHTKSSLQNLTHFLPFRSYQFWKLDSIQFLWSKVHILAGWRLEIRLFSLDYSLARIFLLGTNHVEHTASIVREACLVVRCLGMDFLLLRALARAVMCLSSRCLAVGIHITTWNYRIYVYQREDPGVDVVTFQAGNEKPKRKKKGVSLLHIQNQESKGLNTSLTTTVCLIQTYDLVAM
jgi:hypothetical protein